MMLTHLKPSLSFMLSFFLKRFQDEVVGFSCFVFLTATCTSLCNYDLFLSENFIILYFYYFY